VIIGIAEQDPSFLGTLYLSQLFISSRGEIMGVHRKLVNTLEEKYIFTYGDGSYQRVYDTPFGKLSAMNCGEHAHSLFKYSLLAMGAQIHVASWPSFPSHIYKQEQRDSVDFRVRQFAHEGKIFVINSCSICDRQNIDFCCNTDEEKQGLKEGSGGGSSIIGPGGNYLAGPMPDGEGVLTAEISLEDTLPGKQMHNVVGHYTRWDIFSLKFNQDRLMPFQTPVSPDMPTNDISELEKIRRDLKGLKEQFKEMGSGAKEIS
jgi:aliphatic nitrilase